MRLFLKAALPMAGLCLLAGACRVRPDPSLRVVAIDHSDPAITVLIALPPEDIDALRARAPEDARVTYVPWTDFAGDPDHYLRPHIAADAYPEADAVTVLADLLRRFPRSPFALAWNGGVAVSAEGYQQAQETYQAYLEDPEGYRYPHTREIEDDPLHPARRLNPLAQR